MLVVIRGLRTAGGAVLCATAIWMLLAAPGFLTDRESVVTAMQHRWEAAR
jgi:hypothetical protein